MKLKLISPFNYLISCYCFRWFFRKWINFIYLKKNKYQNHKYKVYKTRIQKIYCLTYLGQYGCLKKFQHEWIRADSHCLLCKVTGSLSFVFFSKSNIAALYLSSYNSTCFLGIGNIKYVPKISSPLELNMRFLSFRISI